MNKNNFYKHILDITSLCLVILGFLLVKLTNFWSLLLIPIGAFILGIFGAFNYLTGKDW